jgi:hypothetical protein
MKDEIYLTFKKFEEFCFIVDCETTYDSFEFDGVKKENWNTVAAKIVEMTNVSIEAVLKLFEKYESSYLNDEGDCEYYISDEDYSEITKRIMKLVDKR